jgi:hypothetical protein
VGCDAKPSGTLGAGWSIDGDFNHDGDTDLLL